MAECPILVWMLSLNREYTLSEYDQCYKLVEECIKHTSFPYQPRNTDNFRKIITAMLPLLMMRHRRIPRAKWKDNANFQGKHWIEQSPEDIPPEKYQHSMIGYHLAISNSLCGMAMTQGERSKVVNIGLGIIQYAVEPRGTSLPAYIESMSHKLTALELKSLENQPEQVMLRRLCILLALKDSYIRALGQPVGFDYARLEFDVANQSATGDGKPLTGWEFRIFTANLGVARGTQLVHEQYECVCAFFRNTNEIKFIWHQTARELESWVQFINIDQMVKVIPKLTA
ncbi:hypothetical protein CC1G_11186 [Coprinopsis cinerea okayama7|uniref:holo-[acyl-carrier-protein] synthase n=1 Tax=Coprinopsis cinerea (strain Okayama-7 / 130 / ATCC MYA-4618 / FGSC 9003) TaxID=240176 RepID=A8P4F8_COPC7|nr:hypothetical protein CC1G_11186 [Coprinopsis cinerea okayama7\|eukprot:XP_001838743.1 hypothetical protein CC1G_11186 [Coprinopsis cinerea okayama7\